MGTLTAWPLEADLLAELALRDDVRTPDALILLPSQRACARLKALLPHGFLPTIMPLGSIDEVWLMQQAFEVNNAEQLLQLPAAADANHCQLQLASHLASYCEQRELPFQFEQSLAMAQSIWRVFETLAGQGIEISALTQLAKGEFSEHWQARFDLLHVAARWWKGYSEKHKVLSPTHRRNLQVDWLAQYWQSSLPNAPVIIAGSTGSQYSTLRLMQAAAALETGEVWLQGVHALPQDAPVTHPAQVMLRVREAISQAMVNPKLSEREQALQLGFSEYAPQQLPAGIQRLDARDEDEEAQLAALLAKQTLAEGAVEVAIITPTPERQRRLLAALSACGIEADSAIGQPLLDAPECRLLRLVLHAATNPADGHAWLALMKQCLLQSIIEPIERKVFRGQAAGSVDARLMRYLSQNEEAGAALESIDDFLQALRWLEQPEKERTPEDWLVRHAQAIKRLGGNAELLDTLKPTLGQIGAVDLRCYQHMLETLLASQKQMARANAAARVRLYTPIEARLIHANRVIMCGLNEGEWPKSKQSDPWLHPSIVKQLGLPDEASQVALNAHDFVSFSMMAPEVFWLRAERVGGSDALASRWLERFEPCAQQNNYLGLARHLRNVPEQVQVSAPAPCPPLAARPDAFSISSLQLLLRDPYAFYAKLILELRKLDPIDRPPDAAMRGEIVHRVMEVLTNALNEGAALEVQTYHRVANEVLKCEPHPLVRYEWAPRIYAMAEPIIKLEQQRRAEGWSIAPEQILSLQIEGVTIEGRADRVEHQANAARVIDYKTGKAPTTADMKLGFEPQLPMLAAMLALPCDEIAYWSLSGVGAGVKLSSFKDDPNELIEFYREGLAKLINDYRSEKSCYYAIPQPEMAPHWNDYAHLARHASWNAS